MQKYFSNDNIRPNDFAFRGIKHVILLILLIIAVYITMYAFKPTRVYIPDANPTLLALIGCLILLLISYLCCLKMNHADTRIEYILVTLCALAAAIMQTYMTYIAILTTFAPLLIAAQYTNKKCLIYTYVLTMISSAAVVYLGYSFGLCDANMIILPIHSISKYNGLITAHVLPLSQMWIPLFILLVLPRFLLVTSLTPLIVSIVDNHKQIIAEEAQSHDGLTGFFNRSKFNIMVKLKYVDLQDIAIIFFDINNLKQTNDHLGHVFGDKLIMMAARSIKLAENPRVDSYRLGGDEFMVIIQDGQQEDIDQFISCWKTNLEAINNNSTDIKCNIAYGYSQGSGTDFDELIRTADFNMYNNKKKMKNEIDFLKFEANTSIFEPLQK